jgi:hypothetical protein
MLCSRLFTVLSLFCLFVASPRMKAAGSSDWPDGNGARFRGEPASIFGPLALFRTKESVVKRVPLRALSVEECQRFYNAIADRPERAARWVDARSTATRELIGNTLQLDFAQRKLVPADLATLTEPELLVVFYGYQALPGSWLINNNVGPNYERVRTLYPGLAHGVFYGIAPSMNEHEAMVLTGWMPWLVTKYTRQGKLAALRRFERAQTPRFAILTRHGDPLVIDEPADMNVVRRLVDEFVELAWLTHPYNASAWPDLEQYGRAVRPLQFASGSTGAVLIGNPLRPDGLRVRGVTRVEARIEIDATGKATAVTLLPGSIIPEKMAGPVSDALRRSAIFLPAIDRGQAVTSTYDYLLQVPPKNPQLDADAAWLDRSMRGETPLRDWLLLTSLPVNESDFNEIKEVDADGTVQLRALEVGGAKVSRTAQANAFHANFFDAAGAASVMPKLGQTQIVDGRTLTWRAVKSSDGYVDMKTGHKEGPDEYCVGYAWTEIEVAANTTAWLGIGSDDGLKVWLNGELVNDRWQHRISQLDDDVVPLQLKAGSNRILLKVQNKTRNWSFIARLRFRRARTAD